MLLEDKIMTTSRAGNSRLRAQHRVSFKSKIWVPNQSIEKSRRSECIVDFVEHCALGGSPRY